VTTGLLVMRYIDVVMMSRETHGKEHTGGGQATRTCRVDSNHRYNRYVEQLAYDREGLHSRGQRTDAVIMCAQQ